MEVAATFIHRELVAEFGLLLCREEVRPFYDRLGWICVPGPTVFDQPSGLVTWPLCTLVLALGATIWPAGTIDLRGLPW